LLAYTIPRTMAAMKPNDSSAARTSNRSATCIVASFAGRLCPSFWTGDFDRHGSAPVLWQRGYESAMALAKQKSFCIAIG
jgi:hypothetical protein